MTREVGRQEIDQVLLSLAVHTAVQHDAQLVCDSLRYIEPVQLDVQEPRQATVKLVCNCTARIDAAFSTRCNLFVATFGVPARIALQ